MLETVSLLEQRLNLDSVRLFLNPFDVTDAFLSVFRAEQISKILEDISNYKVYKKIKLLLSSDGMREYMRQISRKTDDRTFHRFRRFAFFQEGDDRRNALLQLFLYQMIARPMIYRDTDNDEFQDTKVRELAEQQKEAMGEQVLTRRKKELISICYDALSVFYDRVESKEFVDYKDHDFEQYKELFQTDFVQRLQERDQGSAFALYLLANPDVRVNLLSQYFVQRDVFQVMENFELIESAFGERIEDPGELKRKVQMSINHGNKFLQLFSLQQESMFQFPEELGALIEKSAKGLIFLKSDYERKVRDSESRVNEMSERFRRQGERLEEALGDKRDLAQRLEDARLKIHALETTPPEIDHTEEYRRLTAEYKELEKRTKKLDADLKKSEEESRRLRGKNKEFTGIIDEKSGAIRELEAKLSTMEQELEELKFVPRLKRYYSDKTALLIIGVNQQIPLYRSVLEKIFDVFEIVPFEKVFSSKPEVHDMVIYCVLGTHHGEKKWVENRNKNVITFGKRS